MEKKFNEALKEALKFFPDIELKKEQESQQPLKMTPAPPHPQVTQYHGLLPAV